MAVVGLVPLVLLGVVIAVVVSTRRRGVSGPVVAPPAPGSTSPGSTSPGSTGLGSTGLGSTVSSGGPAPVTVSGSPTVDSRALDPLVEVRPHLDRWSAAGVLPDTVRSDLEAFERARPRAAPTATTGAAAPARAAQVGTRVPFVAEAVGYLGGVLTIVAVLVVVSRRWETLAFAPRLLLALVATALAIGAGTAVPEGREPALDRLRWALWSVGTAAAGTIGFVLAERLVATDVERWDHGPTRAIGASLGVTLAAGALWRGRSRPVQAVTALVATLVLAGTLVGRWGGPGPVGGALVLTATPMVVVGLRRRLPIPLVPLAVGCAGTVVGAITLGAGWRAGGQLAGLAVGALLASIPLHPRRVTDPAALAVTGAAAGVLLVAVTPGTIGYWAEGAAYPTAVLTFAAGVGVSVLGISRRTRAPRLVQLVGAVAVVGSPALTCIARPAVGILLGLAVAVALLVLGARPDRSIQSLAGAAGLLGYVPSAIGWFFPGEGRVPLLIGVTGALLVGLAVVLTRRLR